MIAIAPSSKLLAAGSVLACVAALPLACGSSASHELPVGTSDASSGTDAGTPSPSDGAVNDGGPEEDGAAADAGLFASGTHLVQRPSTFQGLTSDGYVVFSEPSDGGGQIAEVIGVDGGGAATIATGTAADKALRIAISGPVVFVWTNRGSRVATLTVWSSASGAVTKGTGIRPGRGAASADGAFIAYVDDVLTASADVVVAPIAGSPVTVGTLNASDTTCWQNVDLGFSGAGPELVSFFCPGTSTAFTLQGTTTAGASPEVYSASASQESIGAQQLVYVDTEGNLEAVGDAFATGDAGPALASGVASFEVSADETSVVFQTVDAGIGVATLATSQTTLVVAAGQGAGLGPLSPDRTSLLYASSLGDAGAGAAGVPSDAQLAIVADGGTRALVATPTSCTGCLNDSFTPDSTYAMVLDPIDDSASAGGVGPLHVFPLDGGPDYRIGSVVWTVIALGTGAGVDSRFLFADSTPSPALSTGYAYDLYARSLDPSGVPSVIASGAEWAGVNAPRTQVVYSIPGEGSLGGVWVAPLQ